MLHAEEFGETSAELSGWLVREWCENADITEGGPPEVAVEASLS